MDIKLDAIEARVLGSLIEKEMTTPEYYPLSLNALTAACNQKTNRDPVMDLEEVQVRGAVEALISKGVAWQRYSPGSRVPKYAHKFADTLSSTFEFSRAQLAVLGVLMLRGPQTPGEIRGRTGRMYEFKTVEDAEDVLRQLATHGKGPFVRELSRSPGKRESRYTQLFQASSEATESYAETVAPMATAGGLTDRVASLEEQLAELQLQVETLRAEVLELRQRGV